MRGVVCITLLAFASTAAADTRELRLASTAPEGTAWARVFKTFGREVEHGSQGAVVVKWYLGGIAGDETEAAARIKRRQIDGIASAGPFCELAAPAFAVFALPGLYTSDEEVDAVTHDLRDVVDAQFRQHGLVNLGNPNLGASIVLARNAASTLDELRRVPLYYWVVEQTKGAFLTEMGMRTHPLEVERAGAAYEAGDIDGFVSVPTGVLAFQMSARARWFIEPRSDYLVGCLAVRSDVFDSLPAAHQQTIQAAAARAAIQLSELVRAQDRALLGGVFQKQGLKRMPAAAALQRAWFDAARQARERIASKLIPAPLIARVNDILTRLRAHAPAPHSH